jgi:dihydrodipicolinate synthase/N-acetylneuraminate lyase
MLTPLAEGGERLDETAFQPMVDFLLERGADGLFLCGTTGEGINLDLEERHRALRLAKEALGSRGDLLVHCGTQNTRDAVALAADAATVGVAGVAVISPPYYPLTDRDLEEHLVAIASACAPTPFYIYAFTARSGYPVPPAVVERVRERATNLAGLKVSEAPFDRVRPYLTMGLPVYIGNEPLIAEAVAATEIAGSVSALASVFPEATRALLDDPTPARAAAVHDLRAAISHEPLIPTAKALLRGRGVPINRDVRAPLRPLAPEQVEAAQQRADALGAVRR